MATLLQTHRVSPPPPSHGGAADDLTLPLTFFDIWWVHFYPIRRVLFYHHPCSTSDFLATVVPNLVKSLSLTLKHFPAAAGHLLYPTDPLKNKPLIRYAAGDAVHLTVAESGRDVDELVSHRPRDADQFYDFVPELPPVRDGGDYKLAPLMAVQATVFPGRGVALGIVNLHCLGDGSAVNASLIFGWASVNKTGRDSEISPPVFDRSVVKDGVGIDTIFWKEMSQTPFNISLSPFPVPTGRVRATFTLNRTVLEKLKNRVLEKNPGLNRVSSFVVTVCYVWSCMAKYDDGDDDVYDLLVVPVDVRGRRNALIDPPVPGNYFGNCIAFAVTEIRHGKLVGEGGFEAAAEAVAEGIKNGVNNPAELLKGAAEWVAEMKKCQARKTRFFWVAGSPKFDLAEADFGWGKARKLEFVTLDGEKCANVGWGKARKSEFVTLDGEKYAMFLANARDGDGLEFGLSLPRKRMEAFAAKFEDGLIN